MLIRFCMRSTSWSMVRAYKQARQSAGHDSASARVIAMYHIYVGESAAEARATAEPALADYHAAAAQARNLTQGIPEPESYRTHDEHRAKMRKLTFKDLVDQSRVLVGSASEVRGKVAQVRERLHLTDLAGNFALGSLPDQPTRATLRRFDGRSGGEGPKENDQRVQSLSKCSSRRELSRD